MKKGTNRLLLLQTETNKKQNSQEKDKEMDKRGRQTPIVALYEDESDSNNNHKGDDDDDEDGDNGGLDTFSLQEHLSLSLSLFISWMNPLDVEKILYISLCSGGESRDFESFSGSDDLDAASEQRLTLTLTLTLMLTLTACQAHFCYLTLLCLDLTSGMTE
jgi:hypothetical protein